MAEIADKIRLHRTLRIVRAAADWEWEAQMLSASEYAALVLLRPLCRPSIRRSLLIDKDTGCSLN
jgi:hypothetical protein